MTRINHGSQFYSLEVQLVAQVIRNNKPKVNRVNLHNHKIVI